MASYSVSMDGFIDILPRIARNMEAIRAAASKSRFYFSKFLKPQRCVIIHSNVNLIRFKDGIDILPRIARNMEAIRAAATKSRFFFFSNLKVA